MVAKIRLSSLADTGTVVGKLSGVGTAGAIAGTVVTGFVLISRLPVSTILVGLGVLLVLGAAAVEWRTRGWVRARASVLVAGLVAGALASAVAPGGCDAETKYHCAQVVADPDRAGGRTLVLDGVNHSYVDTADPTVLEFDYVRALAAAVDAAFPDGAPLAAYHLGGGGLTFPRHLAFVRPGTDSLVSEIDGGVVELDRAEFGDLTGTGIDIRVEDGRLGLERLGSGSRDLIVGDAFGGVSVPWHLTTREALSEVHRVLNPSGVYAANLIDHGDLEFVRAEVATVAEVFSHVSVLGDPGDLGADPSGPRGGNFVVVASDRPVDLRAARKGLDEAATDWTAITGTDLDRWVGDAQVLTDDHAPVDQLLEPFATAPSR